MTPKHRLLLPITIMLMAAAAPFLKKKIFNLAALERKHQMKAVNRHVSIITEEGRDFIRLSENEAEGLVWLPLKNFGSGTVEIRMRGKDVLQRSFIGVAFHALNDSTYDAVYCRPFNFLAQDSVRRIHAIQYIAHPLFTWKKLREERKGLFEKAVTPAPNPNGWFTMRLVINQTQVTAFINESETASLTVKKLNARNNGKLGIFTGDGSGGDFECITITPAK
jgi:hypothetical protein